MRGSVSRKAGRDARKCPVSNMHESWVLMFLLANGLIVSRASTALTNTGLGVQRSTLRCQSAGVPWSLTNFEMSSRSQLGDPPPDAVDAVHANQPIVHNGGVQKTRMAYLLQKLQASPLLSHAHGLFSHATAIRSLISGTGRHSSTCA